MTTETLYKYFISKSIFVICACVVCIQPKGLCYTSDASILQTDPSDTAILTYPFGAGQSANLSVEKALKANRELFIQLQQAMLKLQRRPNNVLLEEELPAITRVVERIQESFNSHIQVLNFQYPNENGVKIPFPQRDIHLGAGWYKLTGEEKRNPIDPNKPNP